MKELHLVCWCGKSIMFDFDGEVRISSNPRIEKMCACGRITALQRMMNHKQQGTDNFILVPCTRKQIKILCSFCEDTLDVYPPIDGWMYCPTCGQRLERDKDAGTSARR
jgi:hypothetical protein